MILPQSSPCSIKCNAFLLRSITIPSFSSYPLTPVLLLVHSASEDLLEICHYIWSELFHIPFLTIHLLCCVSTLSLCLPSTYPFPQICIVHTLLEQARGAAALSELWCHNGNQQTDPVIPWDQFTDRTVLLKHFFLFLHKNINEPSGAAVRMNFCPVKLSFLDLPASPPPWGRGSWGTSPPPSPWRSPASGSGRPWHFWSPSHCTVTTYLTLNLLCSTSSIFF